jgi:hypothetical protein
MEKGEGKCQADKSPLFRGELTQMKGHRSGVLQEEGRDTLPQRKGHHGECP